MNDPDKNEAAISAIATVAVATVACEDCGCDEMGPSCCDDGADSDPD